jgi:hypothetical protein
VAGVEHTSLCSLGCCPHLSHLHLFFDTPTAFTVGGIVLLSIHQLGVATYWYRCHVTLFEAYHALVMDRTAHEIRRMLAVILNIAELLGFLCLYPDCNIAKTLQFQYLMGVFTVVVPSAGNRWVVDIPLMLITCKPRFTNPSEMSTPGVQN